MLSFSKHKHQQQARYNANSMLHFCNDFQIDIQCIFIANDCIEHMEPVLIINIVCAPFPIASHKTAMHVLRMYTHILCQCFVYIHLDWENTFNLWNSLSIWWFCCFALVLCALCTAHSNANFIRLALKMIQLLAITTIKKCYQTMNISTIKVEKKVSTEIPTFVMKKNAFVWVLSSDLKLCTEMWTYAIHFRMWHS